MPDKPRLWAATRVAMTRFRKNMDIHLDGKRFLTLVREEGNGMKYPVTVALNASDAMRRR